ncbi:MAG: hypothetical protein GTO14_12465 [Anaerolineales bacterium]|nr:hypothetical protein [Anaerolineales bacterium]
MNTFFPNDRLLKNLRYLVLVIMFFLLGACSTNGDVPVCDPRELHSPEELLPGGPPDREGEIVDSLTPTFSWTYPDSSCMPEYYRLLLATTWHAFETRPEEFRIDGWNSEWNPESELQPGTTYLWRVQAGSGATIVGGGLGIFRTGPVCDITSPVVLSTPILLWPANGAMIEGVNPTLEWDDPTACIAEGDYIIEISERRDFSDPLLGGHSEPYLFIAHPWVDFDLEECTQYYWRVHFDHRRRPETEDGPYSEIWSFTTTSITGAICPPGYLVTHVPGPEVTISPFVESTISGLVWHDECASPHVSTDIAPPGCVGMPGGGFEANGILDPGEAGIEGIDLQLGTGPCPVVGGRITTTDERGQYSFNSLPAGIYCVSIDLFGGINERLLLPGNWTFPERWYGPDPIEVELTLGLAPITSEVNFGWDYQFLPPPPTPAAATPTPTPEFPIATFLQNANCRRGPGTTYTIVTSMLEGQDTFIEGSNQDNTWWWIRIPQSLAHCWIADSVVSITGPITELPVIPAPPTPAPTNTPIQGCWVWNANLQQNECKVPCPPNPQPGGACTP